MSKCFQCLQFHPSSSSITVHLCRTLLFSKNSHTFYLTMVSSLYKPFNNCYLWDAHDLLNQDNHTDLFSVTVSNYLRRTGIDEPCWKNILAFFMHLFGMIWVSSNPAEVECVNHCRLNVPALVISFLKPWHLFKRSIVHLHVLNSNWRWTNLLKCTQIINSWELNHTTALQKS